MAVWAAVGSLSAQTQSVRERGLQQACQFAYYPNGQTLKVNFDLSRKNVRLKELYELGQQITKGKVELVAVDDGKVLAESMVDLKDGKSIAPVSIQTPRLKGKYQVRFTLVGGAEALVVTRDFAREEFPWEGNQLGLGEDVPPPFELVKSEGTEVSLAGRKLRINGLGLFESVQALGKEILAGPMTIKGETSEGLSFEIKPGTATAGKTTPVAASYTGSGSGNRLTVKTESVIELDGMMRVDLLISPQQPVAVKSLWLEIPIKAEEASLFHQYVDSARVNYAGATPKGDGVIWTSKEARRQSQWQNTFCPYLWLGSEERGLAWFAENDKGWLTERGGSEAPIQALERRGNTVVMKIYLANHEAVIKEPMKVIFGVQVSPTKPMAQDWRKKIRITPGLSGPVHPWGGLHCASRVPWNYDWSVVDKITEGRRTGKADIAWFEEYVKKNNPPKVYGVYPWIDRIKMFAERAAQQGMNPVMVYTEEMRASLPSPEWQTFQDEWGILPFTPREWPTYEIFERGFEVSPGVRVNFSNSYRDYGVYYINEWLKRGASLYWDNTYPQLNYDEESSQAYDTGDGKIQPALSFWNQRAYQKRVYNQLQYWNKNQEFPLEWSVHTTNAQLLPLQTWATLQLDLEFGKNVPFTPEFIRTESIGRQVGNMPYALDPFYGSRNPRIEPLSKPERARINYGMSMVHEVRPSGRTDPKTTQSLDDLLYGSGYGEPGTQVFNYWAENAVLHVGDDNVKWLAFAPESGKEAYVLLASWNEAATEVPVTVEGRLKEIFAQGKIVDAETGEEISRQADGRFNISLKAPYGMRLVKLQSK